MLAPGSQLAQVQGTTSAATLYTAVLRTEIKSIKICNPTGSAATFRLFHDDDGSTYGSATALYFDVSVASKQTLSLDAEFNAGVNVAINGTLGFECSVSNALTVSVYGVVQSAR